MPALLLAATGLAMFDFAASAAEPLRVNDPTGVFGRTGAPVSREAVLSAEQQRAAAEGRLGLVESGGSGAAIAVQADGPRLWWLMPAGSPGTRIFTLTEVPKPFAPDILAAKAPGVDRWDITAAGQPVLSYNYQTNEPGEVLKAVSQGNLKYARPRSDYLHPLHGLDGETFTQDWSVDHPHHRGIYWAWPEVDYGTNRGDLHALQRVFARPTGGCSARSGPLFAQIEATNLWRWEDQEPIVHERAVIRAWHAGPGGRFVDLEFQFTALKDGVTIARRDTDKYGGLNVRLAAVKEQEIAFHTDPVGTNPRRAWAQLSGTFPGGMTPATLAILQRQTNPDYPGDWVKYPELNWFQPTFPASGSRYALKIGQPLTLQFRLWIRRGGAAPEELCAAQWQAANDPTHNPPFR